MIYAAFFDVNNNGFDLADIAAALSFILVLGGTIWTVVHYSTDKLVDKIDERIDAKLAIATKPIQPDANGGKSLPDVAAKAKRTEKIVLAIADQMGITIPDESEDDDH